MNHFFYLLLGLFTWFYSSLFTFWWSYWSSSESSLIDYAYTSSSNCSFSDSYSDSSLFTDIVILFKPMFKKLELINAFSSFRILKTEFGYNLQLLKEAYLE